MLNFIEQYRFWLCIAILFNVLFHIFLVRFFKWNDPKSKLNNTIFLWIILVPPLSIAIALFLIGLGAILLFFDKRKQKK